MIVAKAAVRLPSSAPRTSTCAPRATPLITGLFVLLLTIQVQSVGSSTFTSGEYIKLTDVPEGTLTSPNYPSDYPDYTNAIWLLEANPGNVVNLKVSPVAGDTGGGDEVGYENITGCKDYLEVREGNKQGDVYFHACNSNESVTITSVNRWLWVRFTSNDNITNTGFSATFSQNVTSATQSASSPIPDCQTIRWRCRNMECISYSYRCDRDNDCGCVGDGCDEHHCGGLNWPESTKVAVGTGVGTFIFLLVFFGVGLLDWCLKRRQERENARLQELENSRGRRRPKAPAISMTVPSPAPSANNTCTSPPLASVDESSEKGHLEGEAKSEEHRV